MDEPVLTVTLLAGCNGKTSRTYTFLVDPPASMVIGSRPVAIPRVEMPEVPRAAPVPAVPGEAGGQPFGQGHDQQCGMAPASARRPKLRAPEGRRIVQCLQERTQGRAQGAQSPGEGDALSAPGDGAAGELARNACALQLTTQLQLPEVPATPAA